MKKIPRSETEVCALRVSSAKTSELDGVHTWVAWPAAQRKGRTVGLLLVILVLAILAAVVGGDWLWGLTGAVLLFLAMNRWFLPTSFRIETEAIHVGYPLMRKTMLWKDVRRVFVDARGGWISRKVHASRFDHRSGMDLYWGSDPDSAIAAVVEALQQAEASGVPLSFTDRRGAADA